MSVPQDDAAAAALPAEALPALAAVESRVPLFDRELSWIEFNRRVLGEAQNPEVPLLERVKFVSIASNNLDEFFMIRVGELHDLLAAKVAEPVSVTAHSQKLEEIRKRSRQLLEETYRCLGQDLLPALAKEGIRIERVSELPKKERATVEEYFAREIEPILTPLAIDPGHPFPFIANLTLNLALQLESARADTYTVVVRIPERSPRLVQFAEGRYVRLEDLIASVIERLFPSMRLRKSIAFRVIRNSDISIKEEDVQDLLKSVETELRRRDRQEVVLPLGGIDCIRDDPHPSRVRHSVTDALGVR